MSVQSIIDQVAKSAATSETESEAIARTHEVLWREFRALRPTHAREWQARTAQIEGRAPDGTEAPQTLAQMYDVTHSLDPQAEATATNAPLTALCLSGGGIRSATFNLGVIQALAASGLLRRIDYLSSVSGGGYIASWLRAWVHRCGLDAVDRELRRTEPRDPLNPEPKPIDHLREFSNYLTPRLGLFSADTWTAAAIVIRNLLLNWLVVLPLLAAFVALPQFLYLFTHSARRWDNGEWFLVGALALELIASAIAHWHRHFAKDRAISGRVMIASCVAPVIGAAALLSIAGVCLGISWANEAEAQLAAWGWKVWGFAALWCVVVPFVGWLVVYVAFRLAVLKELDHRNHADSEVPGLCRSELMRAGGWEAAGIILSGAVATLLLMALIRFGLPYLFEHPALYVMLVLPALLGIYLIARTLHVAIASISEQTKKESRAVSLALLNDADREWWARLSGWVLAIAVGWIVVTGICLFGQFLLAKGEAWVASTITAAGGLSGALAAFLASRDRTAPSNGQPFLAQRIALALAAPIFVLCVFALVSWGTASLGTLLVDEATVFHFDSELRRQENARPLADYAVFLVIPLGLATISLVMGWVVNVNRFSLHGMYRNRLVRAYLGASNIQRKPDPFTGFDPSDNLRMHQLRELPEGSVPAHENAPEQREHLVPVINVTLNLLRDDKLAWQQRKAESFSITPYYCGNFYNGYRASRFYGGVGGISLGTAVTISGAAANPHMGSSSSPALAFLMTLFNVRLGAWLGNTCEEGERTYRRAGPRQALRPLLGELFGLSDTRPAYVNLSDGGHFDNLGLYEMILRRCQYIIVCDAGCDPEFTFGDLGNVIRKVRIDFGIPITFEKEIGIFPRSKSERGVYCATAHIHYEAVDKNARDGRILYIKPTVRGTGSPIPYDVYSYTQSVADFPHESTVDQWFSESQFESYRALAEHSLTQVLNGGVPFGHGRADEITSFAELFEKIDAMHGSSSNAATQQEEAKATMQSILTKIDPALEPPPG